MERIDSRRRRCTSRQFACEPSKACKNTIVFGLQFGEREEETLSLFQSPTMVGGPLLTASRCRKRRTAPGTNACPCSGAQQGGDEEEDKDEEEEEDDENEAEVKEARKGSDE